MILSVFVILLLIKVGLNSEQQESFNEHHTSFNFNSMKSFIKKILNITTENQKIDEFIANSFRVDKSNPMYIFLFPDENNRSVIFHRSDFKQMYFPKIPAANKFENNTFNIPSRFKVLEMGSKLFKQITSEKLTQNQFGNFVFENRTNDDVFDSITLQNIRTERNFIKIMNEINDHPETFTKSPVSENNNELKSIAVSFKSVRSKDNYKSHTSNNSGNEENDNTEYNDDWDKLGLQGWSGGIRQPKTDHEYVLERSIHTEAAISNIHIRKPENYASQINFQNSTKTTKINKHRTHQFRHSKGNMSFIESTIIKNDYHRDIEIPKISHPKQNSPFHDIDNRQNISEQLSKILIEERKEFKEKYKITGQKGSVQIPKFLITSSRDQHLDEYVFIARSNNPFGHSTKWKFNSSKLNGPSNSISVPHREGRRKRGVVDLYSMIKCGTGCDPLIFKGYGCYCGFLGSGRALDGIDRCCAMHDYCYSVSSCPMFLEYFVPYLWKCYKGRPLCATDHGEWGGPGSCASRLCECDRVLAKCLRQYYCPETRPVCYSSPWRLFQKLDFGN